MFLLNKKSNQNTLTNMTFNKNIISYCDKTNKNDLRNHNKSRHLLR
jgi:hypothetical protein